MYLKSSIPFIMMIIYILAVLSLSYKASFSKKIRALQKNQTFEEYYTAGKSMKGIVVGLVTIVTFYSGSTFTGKVGFTYNFGMIGLFSIVTCGTVGVIMFFLSEKVWPLSKKYRLSTLSDLLELRYQNKGVKLVLALTIVGFNIIFLITEIRTLGMVVNIASGGDIPAKIGSAIAFIIIVAYVLTGGVRSVAAVDSFSSVIMLGGSVVSIIFIVTHFYNGSLTTLFQAAAQVHPEMMTFQTTAQYGLPYWISILFMGTIVMLVYPSNYMSICLAKSVREVKKSSLATSLSGPWLIVYGIIAYAAIGLAGKGFNIAAPESSLLEMVSFGGSGLMLGLVTTFILAAALGTLDSTLISMSGLISNDVITNFARIRRKEPCIGSLGDDAAVLSERVTKNANKEVRQTRILVLVLGVLAFCLSLFQIPLMVLLQNYATNGLCQIIPAAIGGMYWKKATPYAAITSTVGGVAIYLLFEALHLTFGGFFLGLPVLLINAVIFVAVSLLTYKKYYAENSKNQNIYDDFFVSGRVEQYIKENDAQTQSV